MYETEREKLNCIGSGYLWSGFIKRIRTTIRLIIAYLGTIYSKYRRFSIVVLFMPEIV
jgi:hypothetical protein